MNYSKIFMNYQKYFCCTKHVTSDDLPCVEHWPALRLPWPWHDTERSCHYWDRPVTSFWIATAFKLTLVVTLLGMISFERIANNSKFNCTQLNWILIPKPSVILSQRICRLSETACFVIFVLGDYRRWPLLHLQTVQFRHLGEKSLNITVTKTENYLNMNNQMNN